MKRAAAALLAVVLLSLGPHGLAAKRASGDPLLRKQWPLPLIHADKAWKYSTGRGALVAVIDTGVDLSHPDLRHNIVPGGYDFLSSDSIARDENGNGHGTHVAGIIAATANRKGVVGVAPDAGILPIRACTISDCPPDVVAKAIRYAIERRADIINLSLGVEPVIAEVLGWKAVRDAALEASKAGIVVVAGAGNGSLPLCNEPAAAVVCVGSVGRDMVKAGYSSHDVSLQATYLVAPGGGDLPECSEGVPSTYPRYRKSTCFESGYEAKFGTSMAAPHVAGVAALLSEKGWRGMQIVNRIIGSTTDLGLPGRDPVYGYGLVNAFQAVNPLP